MAFPPAPFNTLFTFSSVYFIAAGIQNTQKAVTPTRLGALPRGVGALTRGVGASPRGVGATPRGVGGTPRGVGGAPRGVGGTPRGVGGTPRGVGGTPRGVGGTPFTLYGRFIAQKLPPDCLPAAPIPVCIIFMIPALALGGLAVTSGALMIDFRA